MKAVESQPTIKTVIEYADKLEYAAVRQIASDPYADPYRPPGSEGARKLCQRIAKQLHDQALQDGLSPEERVKVVARAPSLAIEQLRRKAATADADAREQAVLAQRALERLAGRQAKHRRQVAGQRAGLSPGRRIDQALAALSSISTVSAAVLDGDRVHGGERNQAPQWGGDPAGGARSKALRLAVELEEALDDARVRDLQKAA